jgi:hypothetical protein
MQCARVKFLLVSGDAEVVNIGRDGFRDLEIVDIPF